MISGMPTIDFLLLATGVLVSAGLLAVAILSRVEREQAAFRRALLSIVIWPLPFAVLGLLNFPGQPIFGWIFFGLFWGSLIVLILPIRIAPAPRDGAPAGRHDERDIMFSRATLEPGTDRETVMQLRLGNLNPLAETSGVKERLANLGFDCGEAGEENTPELAAALRAFQLKHGLEVTGEADQATQTKLMDEHQS